MKKNFTLMGAVLLVLAIGIVSAAEYHGTMKVNTGTGSIVIPSCMEDWSGSGWSSCTGGSQTFICFDKNYCDTTNLRPALCGTTQSCVITAPASPSTGGGSGGGGGGSSGGSSSSSSSNTNTGSCVESWQCGEWSNANDACGTRSCTDSNRCGSIQLKPETSKNCPSTSFLSFTGGAIGTLGSFAKSAGGIATFSVLAFVIILAVVLTSKRGSRKKGKTPTVNPEINPEIGVNLSK